MDYKGKSKEWYDEFEKKAYSLMLYQNALQNKKIPLQIAKTFIKVRKEKVKLYGSDGSSKGKLLQLYTVVKTAGLFIKPYPIKKIMEYNGVMLNE